MSLYTFMAPDNAGCNGKLSYEETSNLRNALNGAQEGALDYYTQRISDKNFIISSIDNTGRFCNDLHLFSTAALNHAARDLLNAKPNTVIANVHFSFGNELGGHEDRCKLVSAFATACKDYGISLGKCHSSQADTTQLCIALTGTASEEPKFVPPHEGDIYLTHEIGAFRQIFLAEQGHPVAHYDDAKMRMVMDYRPFVRRFQSHSTLCSDVSGFGLSGTLSDVASKFLLSIKINYALIPFFAISDDLKDVACIQSDQPCSLRIGSDPHGIINLREVSGPVVIFTDCFGSIKNSLIGNHPKLAKIGTFKKSDMSEVSIY